MRNAKLAPRYEEGYLLSEHFHENMYMLRYEISCQSEPNQKTCLDLK